MLTEDLRQKLLALNLVGFVPAAVAAEMRLSDAGSPDATAKGSMTKSGAVKSGVCKVGLTHKTAI